MSPLTAEARDHGGGTEPGWIVPSARGKVEAAYAAWLKKKGVTLGGKGNAFAFEQQCSFFSEEFDNLGLTPAEAADANRIWDNIAHLLKATYMLNLIRQAMPLK